MAWDSNIFTDFSEATLINGTRLCLKTRGRLAWEAKAQAAVGVPLCRGWREVKAMIETASKSQNLLARLVVALMVAFIVAGVLSYDLSAEVRQRVWRDLLERPGQLMSFRFILQPVMAAIAALRDGVMDARRGRSPYFWTLLTHSSKRIGRLREGVISTARILLFAMCMDTVYQLIVLKAFYPAEAVIVALALAFAPYLLLRGPVARIARLWRRKDVSDETR